MSNIIRHIYLISTGKYQVSFDIPMNKNLPLVSAELVEFEKKPVEVQDFRKPTDCF